MWSDYPLVPCSCSNTRVGCLQMLLASSYMKKAASGQRVANFELCCSWRSQESKCDCVESRRGSLGVAASNKVPRLASRRW